MKAIARFRYSRHSSSVCGTGEVAKSANGAEKITAPQSTVTASCRRKYSTLPWKLSNSRKKSAYRARTLRSGLHSPLSVASVASVATELIRLPD